MLSKYHAVQLAVPIALHLSGVYVVVTSPQWLCTYMVVSSLIVCALDNCYQRDGRKWRAFQYLSIWKSLVGYFDGGITVEEPLDNNQTYIFCSFPHGACKS